MKNRAKIGLAISAVIATMTTSTLPAFAEVTDYVTEKDGVKYEYSKVDILNSIINGTAQYERYKTENLYALKDSIQGYIDVNDVMNAIIQSEGSFNVDSYTESNIAKKITISNVKKVDKDGATVEQTGHILEVIEAGVLPGKDKVSVQLVGVSNPEEYEVKFKTEVLVLKDGKFIGVIDSGATIDDITVVKKSTSTEDFEVVEIQ